MNDSNDKLGDCFYLAQYWGKVAGKKGRKGWMRVEGEEIGVREGDGTGERGRRTSLLQVL